MRTLVASLILVLIAVLILLVVFILARRALLKPLERFESRRRTKLAGLLNAWLRDPSSPLPAALASPSRFFDRRLLITAALDALGNASPWEHGLLLEYFERIGQIDRWLAALDSSRQWNRALAAEQLGIARVPRATQRLVLLLGDTSTEVQIRAAQALARMGSPEAMDALVDAVARSQHWSAARVSDLLLEAGVPVVPALLAAYPRLPKVSQLAAIDVLSRLKARAAATLLIESLGSSEADVRARSAAALGGMEAQEATPALMEGLKDPKWPVRAMCAKALGQLRASNAMPVLCAAMRDQEWWVRLNAAEALRSLGPKGLDALVTMLNDQDRFAREQAFAMLEHSREVDDQVDMLIAVAPKKRWHVFGLTQRLLAMRNRVQIEVLRTAQEAVRTESERSAAETPANASSGGIKQ